MTFGCIPTELQDLVVGFCWEITHAELQEELKTIELIKSWNIDPLFVERKMYRRREWYKSLTPLRVYEPIEHFGGWDRLFDWFMVDEVLFRLDFRKKAVNYLGSREHWRESVTTDWKEVFRFNDFYRDTLKNGVPWKPTFVGDPILDFKVLFP